MEQLNWYILTSSGDADNTCSVTSTVGVTVKISLLGSNNRSWSVAVLVVLLTEYCRDGDELAWHGISLGCEGGARTWKDICWWCQSRYTYYNNTNANCQCKQVVFLN